MGSMYTVAGGGYAIALTEGKNYTLELSIQPPVGPRHLATVQQGMQNADDAVEGRSCVNTDSENALDEQHKTVDKNTQWQDVSTQRPLSTTYNMRSCVMMMRT